jgi:class 3 adenylate cyclase
VREPFLSGFRLLWACMRAAMEGRYGEAEQLLVQYIPIAQRTQHPHYLTAVTTHLFDIRRGQGRLGELEQILIGAVEQNPQTGLTQAAIAQMYLETDRLDQAREWFERLAANDFSDIPSDIATFSLTADIASRLGDRRRAALLYEMLQPYAARGIVVGFAVQCAGSASLVLGLLADTMGHWDDAERHFEDALAFDEKIGARPWLARTQLRYASMLQGRDQPGDREKAQGLVNQALASFEELGMKKDVERALALKLRLQGVDRTSPYSSIGVVAAAVEAEQPNLRPHAAPDGTVTLLFTDIEGSTALAQRLGDRAYHALLSEHNRILREQVARHGGHEVKHTGDGFMVAFASAARALSCAVDIQKAFAVYNAERASAHAEPVEAPINVRIGLNTGESVQEEGDYFGSAVTLAARIADKAEGGQILVSEVVRTVGGSLAGVEFRDAGRKQLKGIGRQRVYEVVW